jgi:hypothetical protein
VNFLGESGTFSISKFGPTFPGFTVSCLPDAYPRKSHGKAHEKGH